MTVHITGLRRSGRGHFILLTLEAGEEVRLLAATVEARALRKGSRLAAGDWQAVLDEDEELRCREAAWRLLAIRGRSREEMRRELRKRRFRDSFVDRLIADLESRAYLDDRQVARDLVSDLTERLFGPRRIRSEMARRGLDPEVAAEAVEEAAAARDPLADACALLEKWNRRSMPRDALARRRAAFGFLARRGHDPDIAAEAVRRVLGE